jgi:organic hydroperoxide reductase OsmC/OhrA
MLWYLHLYAKEGVVVTSYLDGAIGEMHELANGSEYFSEVTLHPVIKVADAWMLEKAEVLHGEANKNCFIANSCNFPIHHKPVVSSVDH